MKIVINKGTTFIELIVSIAILGIIAIPLLGMLAASMQNNTYSRSKISNGAVAQAAMEYYKNLGQAEFESCFSGKTENDYYITISRDINKADTSAMLNSLTSAFNNAAVYSPGPDETYESISSRAPGNSFYVAVSLKKIGDTMAKIEIDVWDSVKKDSGKFNLVSLRGI